MPTNDVVLVTLRGHLNNQRWQSGFHIRYESDDATAAELIDDVQTIIVPDLVAATCAQVSHESVRVFDTDPAGTVSLEVSDTDGLVGTLVGTAMPGQCPVLLDVLTGQKGRRARGRMFLPIGATTHVALGKISGAGLTAAQTFAGTLTDTYGVGGTKTVKYQAVIWSPAAPDFVNKKGVHTRLTDLVTPITSWRVNEFVKTLHRRAIGVGE